MAIELRRGDTIQDYTLVEFISSGGTAEVWHVTDVSGQDKALKLFSPVKGMDTRMLDTLFEEFRLTLNLDHSNVLKPEKLGSYKKVPYIIMPLCKSSLEQEMRNRMHVRKEAGRDFTNLFTEGEINEFIEQISSGLDYLHQEQIIHQDIKPDNILIREVNGQNIYVLSDFGISTKLRENMMKHTMSRQMSVSQLTPAYAAPEQFEGNVSYKSDIFSLGLILFEMIEGQLPFSLAQAAGDLIRRGQAIPNFKSFISYELRQTIESCLSLAPESRPNAAELSESLIEKQRQTQQYTPIAQEDPKSNERNPISKPLNEDDESQEDSLKHTQVSRVPPMREFLTDSTGPITQATRQRRAPVVLIGILLVFIVVGAGGLYFFKKINDNQEFQIARYKFNQGDPGSALVTYDATWKLNWSDEDRLNVKASERMSQYEKVEPFQNDMAAVLKGSSWGFVDRTGREVVQCKYDEVIAFRGDETSVLKNGVCGIIDNKGNIIEDIKHTFCYFDRQEWGYMD